MPTYVRNRRRLRWNRTRTGWRRFVRRSVDFWYRTSFLLCQLHQVHRPTQLRYADGRVNLGIPRYFSCAAKAIYHLGFMGRRVQLWRFRGLGFWGLPVEALGFWAQALRRVSRLYRASSKFIAILPRAGPAPRLLPKDEILTRAFDFLH